MSGNFPSCLASSPAIPPPPSLFPTQVVLVICKHTSRDMHTNDIPLDKAELLAVILEALLYGKFRQL